MLFVTTMGSAIYVVLAEPYFCINMSSVSRIAGAGSLLISIDHVADKMRHTNIQFLRYCMPSLRCVDNSSYSPRPAARPRDPWMPWTSHGTSAFWAQLSTHPNKYELFLQIEDSTIQKIIAQMRHMVQSPKYRPASL